MNPSGLVNTRPKANQHVVANVHFDPGCEVGPCECKCGAAMPSDEFAAHRREEGQRASSGQLGVPDMLRDDPNVWKAKCKVPSCIKSAGKAKGYCSGHYDRARNGRPLDTPLGPPRGKNLYGRAGIAGVGR